MEVAVEGAADSLVIADTTRKTFTPGLTALTKAPADKRKHLVLYRNEADAVAAGFAPREATAGRARTG
jgi:hypothetical protein